MEINLSDRTFTDESDFVPSQDELDQGVPMPIGLGAATVNTLAGDDVISGRNFEEGGYGFANSFGTLNTNSGNDLIQGYGSNGLLNSSYYPEPGVAILNTGDGDDRIEGNGDNIGEGSGSGNFGIYNDKGTIDTGDGNDVIWAFCSGTYSSTGIINEVTTIDTGNGDDVIDGYGAMTGIDSRVGTNINTGNDNDIIRGSCAGYGNGDGWGILLVASAIDTGEGNDIIDGFSYNSRGMEFGEGSHIDTGEGDDIITGTGFNEGIVNGSTVNTGNGADSIISQGRLINYGEVFLGDGNDSITAITVNNYDIITSAGIIYNYGVINTGNGADSIIADEGFNIADEGFNDPGSVFLGEGEDYIKGFGSGEFSGGNGFDRLELTPGSYTVGISPAGRNFAKDGIIMNTVGFEQLIAGATTYDFSSLTNGQTITVA